MNKLFGVDFGTGGCKATVIDMNGNICATAFQEYPSDHNKPGWSEQDPNHWIKALITTVKSCKEQMKDGFSGVLALAVTASTHNAVLLDDHSSIIRPCIMWNDQRSNDQCVRLKENYGDILFKIGMQMPTPTWTLPQLMWIKEHEPDNYAKIARIMFTKDYMRSFLTGDFITDIVDAQGSLLFDARKNCWSQEICNMIDLKTTLLPAVHKTKEVIGTVQAKAALVTGLPEGLPVIAGCSDTAAEDFSAGAVSAGQIIVKLATAGNVNLITDKAVPHEKTFTYPYSVEGKWYTVSATNSCASAYRWMRDALYQEEKRQCEREGKDVYLLMDEQASKAELGARGLIFHPYLLGERCPYFNANARANFFGISMIHNKCDFARSLLEGVAFSLYDCLQVLSDFTDKMEDIVIIGGGANSPLWSQIVCDVFGLEVKRPEHAESSFGGALLAGVGIGAFSNEIEAAQKCVRMKQTHKPNPQNHIKYKQLFSVYKDIATTLPPIWEKLAHTTNE